MSVINKNNSLIINITIKIKCISSIISKKLNCDIIFYEILDINL